MIKVLREALVVSNVHRVLGIVNGTTNFVLTEMERGATYDEALAEAQRLGFAEADPTEDVSGAGRGGEDGDPRDGRVRLARARSTTSPTRGSSGVAPEDVAAARELEMVVRLVGAATLVDGAVDVRVGPALVDRRHPLAAVEGAFNAVMLQGDAIREITLEGPGAGGLETASAVVADMVTIVGTTGTGFLQNDACWRELERLPQGELPLAVLRPVEVADRPGVLALVALRLAAQGVSVARLVQHQGDGAAALAHRHARGATGPRRRRAR